VSLEFIQLLNCQGFQQYVCFERIVNRPGNFAVLFVVESWANVLNTKIITNNNSIKEIYIFFFS